MFQFNACVIFWDLRVSHMFLCPFQRSVSEAAATPSKRLPPATLGGTWGHPCVSLCLLGADLLAHTPSRQTATQVLVKRKLGINSALSTHKGLLPLLSVDHLVEIPSQQYLAETNKSLISFIPASTKKILSNLFFRCVAVYGNKSI